jgi:hypothetical protein
LAGSMRSVSGHRRRWCRAAACLIAQAAESENDETFRHFSPCVTSQKGGSGKTTLADLDRPRYFDA